MKLILINNSLKDTDVGYSVEIDVSTTNGIKEVIQTIDPINPISYKNNFSKIITLWSSPQVNEFFNTINRIDAVYSKNNINLSVKNSFVLHNDYNIIQQGYFVVDSMTFDKFNIRLFGDFGKVMYLLSNGDYVDSTNPNLGTSVMLRNMNIQFVDNSGNPKQYTINKELIYNCFTDYTNGIFVNWNDYTPSVDSDGNVTYPVEKVTSSVISFVPTYQGKYQFFDNKVTYRLDSNGIPNEIEQLENISIVNEEIVSLVGDDNIDENNRCFFANATSLASGDKMALYFGDYRSYYQRPAISVKWILNEIFDYINNLGYKVELDPAFFNVNIPYYQNLWCVLDNLPILEKFEYDGSTATNTRTVFAGINHLTSFNFTRFVFGEDILNNPLLSPLDNSAVEAKYYHYYTYNSDNWYQSSTQTTNRLRAAIEPTPFQYTQLIDSSSDGRDELVLSIKPTINLILSNKQIAALLATSGERLGHIYYKSMNGTLQRDGDNIVNDMLDWITIEVLQFNETTNDYTDSAYITSVRFIEFLNLWDDGMVRYLGSPTTSINITNDWIHEFSVPNKPSKIVIRPTNNNGIWSCFHSTFSGTYGKVPYTNKTVVDDIFYDTPTARMSVFSAVGTMMVDYYTISNIKSDGVRSGSNIDWSIVCRSTNTMFDFLISYAKTFGLICWCDSNKTFHIDSRNNYYKFDGTDITDKVIRDNTFGINPIPFEFSNAIFGFLDSDSYIEKQYMNKTNSSYGNITVLSQNNNTNETIEVISSDQNIFYKSIVGTKIDAGYLIVNTTNDFTPQLKALLYDYTESNNKSNASFELIYLTGNENGKRLMITDDDNFQRQYGYRFFDFTYSRQNGIPDFALDCSYIPKYDISYENNYNLVFGQPTLIYGSQLFQQYSIYNRMHKQYYDDLFNTETRLIIANIYLNDSIVQDINRKIFVLYGRLVNIYKVHDYQWGRAGVYKCEMMSINNVNSYTDGQELSVNWIIFSYQGTILISTTNVNGNPNINDVLNSCIIPLSDSTRAIDLDLSINNDHLTIQNVQGGITLSTQDTTSSMSPFTITLPASTVSYRFSFDAYSDATSQYSFGTIYGIVGAINAFRSSLSILVNGVWTIGTPTTNAQETGTPAVTPNGLKINSADPLSEYPYPNVLAAHVAVDTTKYGLMYSIVNYAVASSQGFSTINQDFSVNTQLECNETIQVDVYMYDVTTNTIFTAACDVLFTLTLNDGTTLQQLNDFGQSLVIPNNYQSYTLTDPTNSTNFSWYKVTNADGSVVDYVNGGSYPTRTESVAKTSTPPTSVACVYNQLYVMAEFNNSDIIDVLSTIDWVLVDSQGNQTDLGGNAFYGNEDYVFDNPNNNTFDNFNQTVLRFNTCDYNDYLPNSGDITSGFPASYQIPTFTVAYPSTSLMYVDETILQYTSIMPQGGVVLLFNNITNYQTLVVQNPNNGLTALNYTFPSGATQAAFFIPTTIMQGGNRITVVDENTVWGVMTTSGSQPLYRADMRKIYGNDGSSNFSTGGVYAQPCSAEPTYLTITAPIGSIIGNGLNQITNNLSELRITLFDNNMNVVKSEQSYGAGTYTYENLDSSKQYYWGVSFRGEGIQYSIVNAGSPYDYNGNYTLGDRVSFTTNIVTNNVAVGDNIAQWDRIYTLYSNAKYAVLTTDNTPSSLPSSATTKVYAFGSITTPTDLAQAEAPPANPRNIGTAVLTLTVPRSMVILDPTTLLPSYPSDDATLPYGYLEWQRGGSYSNWQFYDITNIQTPFTGKVHPNTSSPITQSITVVTNNPSQYNNLNAIQTFTPFFSLGSFTYIAYNPPTYFNYNKLLCTFNPFKYTRYTYRLNSQTTYIEHLQNMLSNVDDGAFYSGNLIHYQYSWSQPFISVYANDLPNNFWYSPTDSNLVVANYAPNFIANQIMAYSENPSGGMAGIPSQNTNMQWIIGLRVQRLLSINMNVGTQITPSGVGINPNMTDTIETYPSDILIGNRQLWYVNINGTLTYP